MRGKCEEWESLSRSKLCDANNLESKERSYDRCRGGLGKIGTVTWTFFKARYAGRMRNDARVMRNAGHVTWGGFAVANRGDISVASLPLTKFDNSIAEKPAAAAKERSLIAILLK